ncbi:MAG TPA: hypothetical protein PK251_14985 [Candidatus Latescibacteria bacterium]|nr:hypothetical protein [Kiritimatiellia bacterium]HOS66043.1 hypothetical protein [Candidatus Latescibacterota bacterium]HRT28424.1 hypothetical protein [Kiritimatiellia bacterium]
MSNFRGKDGWIGVFVCVIVLCVCCETLAALKYEPSCYVQDGLVAHFDGLRNAGMLQAHNGIATNWVDLSANGNDAILKWDTVNGSRWATDGFTFEKGSYFEQLSDLTFTNTITIQVVCEVDTNLLSTSWPQLVGAGDSDRCNIYVSVGSGKRLTFKNANTGNTYIPGGAWEGRFATAIRNGTQNILSQTGDGSEGATVTTSGGNIGTHTWRIGAASSVLSTRLINYLTGKIQAVRIYDRVLTTEELLTNRALDDARYKTGLPVTNVIVATSVRGIEGTESAGVYAVDGSHTFTAPESVTKGADTYTCSGYTLETWDAGNAAWGDPVTSAERAYTASDSGKVRLIWTWTHTAGPGALDVDAYSQDGLAMFFDGFRNAGRDVPHDSSATKWANLAVNANDATLYVEDPVSRWRGDGFYFGGASYGQLDANQRVETAYTIQVVCDVDTATLKKRHHDDPDRLLKWPHLIGAGSADNCNVFYRVEDADSPICFKDTASNKRYDLYAWLGDDITLRRDGCLYQGLLSHADGNWVTASINNLPVGSRTWYIATAEGSGSSAKAARFLTGIIHAIRMYDRVLTDEEIAEHRVLDNARFWGRPTSNGMVVVASRIAGLEGVEPNGTYRPASHTFSAPTGIQTLDGREYQADGYVVETWDAARETWITPEAGTGHTWTSPSGVDWASRRLTWKWKLVRGLVTYDVGDYVQEGLIVHFDGIRNVGADLPHDSTAGSWQDLSPRRSRGLIIQRMPDTSGWLENGYSFAGSNYVQVAKKVSPGSEVTLEMLLDVKPSEQKGKYPTFFSGYENDSFVFFIRDTGTTLEWKQDVFAGTGYNNRPKATSWQGKDFVGVMSATHSTLYENGVKKSEIGRSKVVTYDPAFWRLMANAHNWVASSPPNYNGQAIGKVFTARFYNRALTDAERAWNRKVDQARYEGILPVTNVVVAVGKYATTTEAPGCYEVAGSWSFTASDATEEGKTHRVSGYTLEAWANDAWSAPTSHTGASYTYVQGESPAMVRLTWRWTSGGTCVLIQ